MITFRCGGCGHSVRVKDEHAGKQGRCPACGWTGQIPSSDAGAYPQTSPPAGASAPSASSAKAGYVKFRCSHCGKKIGVRAENAGRQVRCPQCGQTAKVPVEPESTTPQPDDAEMSLLALAEQETAAPVLEQQDLLSEAVAGDRASALLKSCPFCGEQILATANKCKHCGEFLTGRSPVSSVSSVPSQRSADYRNPWIKRVVVITLLGALVCLGVYFGGDIKTRVVGIFSTGTLGGPGGIEGRIWVTRLNGDSVDCRGAEVWLLPEKVEKDRYAAFQARVLSLADDNLKEHEGEIAKGSKFHQEEANSVRRAKAAIEGEFRAGGPIDTNDLLSNLHAFYADDEIVKVIRVSSVSSRGDGSYSMANIKPGRYYVYCIVLYSNFMVTWVVPIDVKSGTISQLDLKNANAVRIR